MKKSTFFILTLVLVNMMTSAAMAKSLRAKRQGSKPAGEEYSTSMSFEGSKIKGKVQSGSLRKIVVENDKSLDDLLGVRKHFDDRELQEKGRVTTW